MMKNAFTGAQPLETNLNSCIAGCYDMLLKNITYTFFGQAFAVTVNLIAIPLYLSQLDLSNYAIVGLIFSFFSLFHAFDIPTYLTLVKTLHDRKLKKKHGQLASALFSLVVITNVILLVPLILIALFMSRWVYHDQNLVPFFLIAFFIFALARANFFLIDVLRSGKQEDLVQKIAVPCTALEFVVSMGLLFGFGFGVWSIFIGILAKSAVQYFSLMFAVRKRLNITQGFSCVLVKSALKKYTFDDYKLNIANNMVFSAGLFLSTFFLSRELIGILAVFFKFVENLWGFTAAIFFLHLQPVLAKLAAANRFLAVKQTLKGASQALILFSLAAMAFLLAIGKHAYYLYLGPSFNGTFLLFLLITSAVLMRICVTPLSTFLYISNTGFFKKLNLLLLLSFLPTLLIGLSRNMLDGVIIAYALYFYLFSMMIIYFALRSLGPYFPEISMQLRLLIMLQIVDLLLFGPNVVLPILISVSLVFIMIMPMLFHKNTISPSES